MKAISPRKIRRARAARAAAQPRRLRPLGVSLARYTSALAVATALLAGTAHSQAATYYWDSDATAAGNNATTGAGLGGTGTWDLTLANWWDLTNDILWPNLADTAIFTGTAGTVTLGVPITTGGLTFNTDGYTLTGSTLTLAGPATINAAFGTVAKIDSIVAGTSGLTKTGAGTVWLTNTGNTFSGDLVINDGTIVVSDPAQLGTGTTAISINGIPNTGNPGFSGGSLVLQGGMGGTGMTINREISVAGRGPNAANAGGGLISIGYNTIAGGLVIGNPGAEGRLLATYGITTITGGVQLGTGAPAYFYGNGNWIISGKVTGFDATLQDRLIKTGGVVASTLWLQNNSNDFAQPLRIDGANSSGNGVRVSSNAALGASTSTLGLDMNGGVLEVRTDAPDFNNRNINFRGNTSRIFVDHALGSSLVNQNVVIGGVLTNSSANASIVHSGRNGYNLSLGNGSVMNWPAGGNLTIYNTESSGTLTFNASISRASEGTARTLTITPSGEIIFTGDILQVGAGAVSLTKNNTGMLTLQGTGTSTATGTTTINAGTITIGSFGQLPTGEVRLGNATTTSGALNYAGAGETSSAAIKLNTTTANVYLNANGSGALVLDGTITTVAGNKTLVLGGASTAANEIASAIPNSTNLSLQKIGSGTWVLSGANAFTGGSGVTISGGTLQVKDTYSGGSRDVIGDANAVVFNTDLYSQAAGGTFEYLGAATSTSSENLGTLTATTGAGTIKVTPGTGGTATLTFGSLGTVATGTGVNVLNTGTVNVTGTAGFLNPHITYNGVDFAYSGGGTTLRAPVYDTDAGFVTAGAALTGSSHNLVNSSTSTGAVTISSLKISGSQTVDQTGLLTIQTAPGAPGGIIQTGGAGIIQGTGITTGSSGDLVIRVDGSGDSLTLAAPITNTTDGGLTKNGAGLLLLQGAQAYDGTTTVNEGTLKVDTGSRLGGGSASNNNNLTVRQDGALDINGNNLGVAAFNGAGTVTNSSATAATLTIGNNNQSGYYSGLISGNLGITKAGTGGAMSITGANTFTGATTLGGGTLIVNNLANIGVASAIGAGDATNNATNAASLVFNGGTLRYQGSNSVLFQNTQTPSVSTDRLFTLAANGSIESSGSFGAPTLSYTSNNAALVFNNTAPVAFSGAGARTLTLAGDSNGDNRINLQLIDNPNASEPLSVTKAGSSNGLWILGNTGNSYSGNTTISAGYLQVGDDSAPATRTLPTTSALVLGTTTTSGILQTSGLFTRPIAATATPGSVTWGGTTGGGGFSASPGRLTVNLGGAGATLTWGSGGFVGTGGTQTLFLSSNTAVADVELVNGIDLNGANRTIQVDDNVYTGLDYATISGVISNSSTTAAGFTKSGGGNLILAGPNTYNGNTTISSGALIVGSIGAAGDTSGSLGTNVGGGNLLIGNGTTTGGILLYVGPGETTTRTITLNTTTATNTIDSSGSGPLVISSLTTGVAGAKTMYLRGTNTDMNTVTSVLANNGGALSVQKYDGGVWVLNPSSANTFTGDLVAGGGTLGLTANGIGSAARLRFSNGAVAAWGGDLTTSVPVSLANNTTTVFSGKNNITFNSNVTKDAGANDQTFSNNLENGAVLTINGNYVNLEAPSSVATRILYVRGYGSTVWNGIIQNEAANKSLTLFDIRIADSASFTLGNANTLTGGIRLGQGTLIVGNTLGLGPAANTVTLYGGTLTSTVDLAGANKIANQVVLSGDQVMINGSQNIELGASSVALLNSGGNRFLRNELDAGKTLTISGKVSLTNDGTGRTLTLRGAGETVISGVVQNGGSGGSGLAYSGLSTLTLTGANTATGNLTVNRNTIVLSGTSGGSWNSGPVTVNPIGTLRLDNSGGDNPAGRLNDTGAFTGNGGTLDIISDSDGTNEVTGALTLNSVQTFVTLTDNSGGAGNTLTFASVSLPNSGSSLNLAGVPNLGGINKVKFTTAPTGNALINSVAPRFFIGGDFATYDGTDGVKAFSNYNPSSATDINAAATTDTIEVNAGMTTPNLTASRTVNALKIDGAGLSAGGTGKTMTLAAAAILNTGGDNSLDLNGVNFGSNTGIIQVESGTTLTVNSTLMGISSWAKTLPGTLTINTPTFISGTTNILRGTVKLNAGLNTLFPNQLLLLNDGATLDLNGNTQFTGYLTDPGILPESGGLITSSAGTGTLVTNMAATSALFATTINGNVNFARVGGNTLTLESVNTYSGSTTMMGGTLQIQDDSSILNTSSITLNAATLTLNNNSSLQRAIYDRVGDTTPITLRTGAIYFYGKVSDPSYEVMGPVTAAEGANTLYVQSGGFGTAGAFSSADVTFASLTRAAGATVNFAGTSGLGVPGNNARIFFTTPLTTQGSGVLGAWAIGNYTDYAAYNTTNGVSYVGSGGYTGYDSDFGTGKITGIGTLANSNVTTTLPGSATTALLRLSGNFTNNLAFTGGSDVLNLELGGILRSNNAFDTTIGTTATRGVITAGGTEVSGVRELVIYNYAGGNPSFGSATINPTTTSVTMSSTVGLQPGMTIANSNFPAGTTVVSIPSLQQVILSQPSTNVTTQTSQTFTGGSYVNGVTTSGSAAVTMNSTVGLAPGMTFTGTNIPAGSYIVSVDSATQVTLSQNATAAGTGISFTGGFSNMIVNSVIQDNGFGNSVMLVKSGAGVLNLSANNTYTGGTVVNQGTLNLIGSGVVIPAGGVTINNSALAMLTNNGQIASSNTVTLIGDADLTLAGTYGADNTLDRLIFNNNGSSGTSTVSIPTGSILNLTNSTPVTITSNNATVTPTISGGFLGIGAGANTFNIGEIQAAGQTYTRINPTLNITSAITGLGSSMTKTGGGLLQLSGQSNFTGGVALNAGALIIGTNSTPVSGGTGLTSGPLGTGALTVGSGLTLLVDTSSRTFGNDVTFAGTPTFDATSTNTVTLTLNGQINGLPNGAVTVNVINPYLTVNLLGTIPNIASITSITSSGLGKVFFNSAGYTGTYAAGGSNVLSIFHDGNGTGQLETINLGSATFDPGIVPNITIGRAGGTLPFNLALNKTIELASITSLTGGLTVTNNNQYKLRVPDAIALASGAAFSVANATNSNYNEGLELSGILSGSTFTKSGNGALLLSNAGNTFTGDITVKQGVLAVADNAALGNAANMVILAPAGSDTATFRATDNITTSRVVSFGTTTATRAIEVVAGKTLQLDSTFDLTGGAGAVLTKNDQGVLVLNADNDTAGWTGGMTINGGAVRAVTAGALGALGQVNIPSVFGAALQLGGGLTVNNPININNGGSNIPQGGINFGGQLQNFAGTNTYSGAITMSTDAGIGAEAGTTLNITGGISMATSSARALFFNAKGDINISGTALTGGVASAWHRIEKMGPGTLTISNANTVSITGDTVKVRQGTLAFTGAGTLSGATPGFLLEQGGTLSIDNTGTNTNNRLGARPMILEGGTFNYTANGGVNSSETMTTLSLNSGGSTINMVNGGGFSSILTYSALTQNGGGSLNLTGTFGSASNALKFTTAPALLPAGTGLLARVTVNGNEFATYNATNGVTTFTGYAPATNILSAGATQTFQATSSTANSLTTNQTLNALNLKAGGMSVGAVSGLIPTTLTLTSGAVLTNGGGGISTLAVPVVSLSVEGFFHVQTGQELQVSSGLMGTAGFTKALGGNLSFTGQQFYSGTTTVNGGTMKLMPTATNTLLFNNSLTVNTGATLDLNGGTQFIGNLVSSGAGPQTGVASGGTVTNSSGTATLVTNGSSSFGGQITGAINLVKSNSTLNLTNVNSYTGTTTVTGGTITLADNGALTNTTAIELNYATITAGNRYLYENNDRINDAAPITLRGGMLNFDGRAQSHGSETIGDITVAQGLSFIFPNNGGTGVNSFTLNMGKLLRAAGSTATLRFNQGSVIGLLGSNPRAFFTEINGVTTTNIGDGLNNNIIGPWAIVDRDWATYVPTLGVGTLGSQGFAGYAGSGILTAPLATDNVRYSIATGTTVLPVDTVVSTLNISQSSNAVLDLNTKTLRMAAGGLLLGMNADNTSLTIQNGTLTSGTVGSPSDFYITHAAFDNDNRNVIIGAVIADNGVGGTVRFIKNNGDIATGSTFTLNAANSYTGGTVLNAGTTIVGATGVLPAGGTGIELNSAILTQAAGGVIQSQALTLNGPSTVNLVGVNTLTSVTFNNNGGGNSNLNPGGTLTLTGSITSTPRNVGGIATIGTGTIDLNANAGFSIDVDSYDLGGATDVAPWQAGLNINAVLDNGGVVKTGAGVLQLSGQSTFTGGVSINAGGLILGADSTPNLGPATIVSGPVGTGALTMAANTSILAAGGARTILNDVTFLGDTDFNGTNNLTLNGVTTLPSIWNAKVTAPQMTVTIADATPSLPTDTINKSGLGILNVGNYAGTIAAAGAVVFTGDGNLLGTVENVALGGGYVVAGDTALTINHSGAAANARNKVLQKTTLSIPGNILAVSNLSGYGLEFTGATTMTGPAHFSIGTATQSNVVQGLILSGIVSGAFDLTKSGPGTLVLGNAANTFGGAGKTIDILNGILSVGGDGALGDAANTVTLDVDASTGVGLRATDTFTTGRTIVLNQANNAIEAIQGKTLTISAPFSVPTATNTLTKNDNGVVAISADNNPGWTGAVNINAGALQAQHNDAFGTGTVTVTPISGAAVQLSGGVNVANPFAIVTAGVNTGINNGGVIQSVSGTNTWSGVITQPTGTGVTLGADAGAVLNITGGVSSPGSNSITFSGDGDINFTTTGMNTGNGLYKLGNGKLTITVANPGTTAAQALGAFDGEIVFAGGGTLGPAGTSTGTVTVDVGATLTLDNTTAAGGNVNNRLGTTRPINFRGGNFNLIGNESANTLETFAGPSLLRGLTTITVTAQPGQQADLLFTGSANVPANAQNSSTSPTGVSLLFRGTSLGSAAGPGIATIKDIGGTNGFPFNGQSGAAGTKNKGLMPYALIDTTATGSGISFATGDGTSFTTSILRPLAPNEYETANTITANNNILLNSGTVNVPTGLTPNSLTFDAGANLTLGNGVLFSLSSGGILVRSGSVSSISGGVINQTSGFSPLNIWTIGDLTISSTIYGGNGTANGAVGLVKAGAGTLTLSPATSSLPTLSGVGTNLMSGQLVINQGTVVLNGGKNTIEANNFLTINGGTLDLNGNSQQVYGLLTDGAVAGAGGTVTSSSGTGNFVINQDNATRNWAGQITGNVNFTRSGQNTLNFLSPQTYSGTTLINGGTTVLRDNGGLTNTTAIDINFATLTADNNTSTTDLQNGRLNDSANITMRGSTLNITGRSQTASVETIGAIILDAGYNVVSPNVGGTGVNSMEVTSAGLLRTAGSTATLQVGGSNLGTIGNSSRLILATINGTATDPVIFGGGLTNNIVGGWAEVGSDFATYIPGLGLAALNQQGAPGYDFTTVVAGSNPTKNARITVTSNVPAGGADLNALAMSGSIALNFANATDTLNLTSGGLIAPNSTQNMGVTLDSGRITAGGPAPVDPVSDLYLFNRGGTLTINSRIIDNPNGATSKVRAVLTASGGAITFVNPNASYTGGTVLNGGTLNLNGTNGTPVIPAAATPADGLVINSGTVTMNYSPGQIDPSNIVTLTGSSAALNLWGDNTLAGLVYNNVGGSGNLIVQSYSTSSLAGSAANGVLTIGSSGISVTSANVGTGSYIVGRVDFGASPNTITVDSINANGTNDIAPFQAAFLLQGMVGSSGGVTKNGAGVLQFNTQATFTGPLTIAQGGLRNGVTNSGSRYSALTLNSGTRYDLNGASPAWGSLAGSGTVFNSGRSTPTLTVGFDNTSTTFSGQFARFNDGNPNAVYLNKVGSGTWTLDSAQSSTTGSTGSITISGGTLAYAGAGQPFPSVPTATAPTSALTFTVNAGSTLKLDNAATNVNNRLALNNGAGQVTIQGGTFQITGNNSVNTSELLNNVTFITGGGFLAFAPDAASQLDVTVTTLSNANSSGTGLITGIDGAASAPGKTTLTMTTVNTQGGQGGGVNGTSNRTIRGDILADALVTGLGTGFLVKDSVTNLYRPLGGFASGELNTVPSTWVTAQNAGIDSSAQTILANTTANSLTIGGVSSLGSGLDATTFGNYGPGGLLAQTLNTSSTLALDGSTVAVNVGSFNGTAGNTLTVHTVGTALLNVNSYFGIGNTAGLVKADSGTLNLNKPAFYTGGSGTVVNGGALTLNSGAANTIAVVPRGTLPDVLTLQVNGTNAVVDLKGFDQAVAGLTTNNPTMGGTVTNSSGTLATLTSTAGGTFAGQLTGANLAFTRSGNNTTLFTSPNTYGGPTIVRGGTLQLRDAGTIAGSSAITVNNGALYVDNFGLNPIGNLNPTRIAATTPVTLQSGELRLNGGGSMDSLLALDTVTLAGGGNSIAVYPQISMGDTAKITIGNLVRNASNHSIVSFNGWTTNNSSGTSSLGGQGLSVNGNIILGGVNGQGLLNLALANSVTTASSNIVTVSSTADLLVGAAVTGTGIPANEFVTQIIDATHVKITTGTGVTAQAATTLTFKNLTNNLIGGWAIADQNTFATYVTGYGVSVMGQTTQGIAAPAFDGGDVSAATTATQNISDGGNRTITANRAANSWRFVPGATQTITLNSGVGVTLGVGIITNANFGITIAGTDSGSTITTATAGSDLTVYVNQNTTTIGAKLIGSMNLVKSGGASLTLSNNATVGDNTFSGGTYVQQGTLNLSGAAGVTLIPGDLFINNATVNQNTNNGQIAATSNVTIGAGTLDLKVGTNTLASVTFNSDGAAGNPTLAVGAGALTISAANAITAANDSFATSPVISGAGGLILSDANPVITTSGLSPNDLNITTVISSAGGPITKTGPGSLTLSAANTFTTGFNLNQGTLILGINTTGSITNGPVGTGTLTIAGGTTVMSDSNRTVANATTVNGDFTFGGVTATNNLTLSGAMDLGATGRIITVSSPAVTGTISGPITSTAAGTAITKAGPGTLTLSNATSNLGGAGVLVSEGILKIGGANAVPNTSLLTVSPGAGFDLAGNDEAVQQIAGTGFYTNSSNNTKTLTIAGASATDTTSAVTYSFGGALTDNRGAAGFSSSALALTKAGSGTITFTGTLNNYFGATTVVAGSLLGGATNTFSPNSTVVVGNAATAAGSATATFDTGAFDQTIGGLTASPNTAAGTAVVNIPAAQTLTVNGSVTLGSNTSATDVTNVNFTGGGALVVNGPLFQVGGGTGATNANVANADLTGIGSLTANLGATGVFRVGDNHDVVNGVVSTLILPAASTVTANIVGVGGESGTSVQLLKLGSGATALNANTINIGSAPTTGQRGSGSLVFNGATGTLKVRSQADPVNGRADLNMVNATFATGATVTANFDATGHGVDLLFDTMVLGSRSALTGGATATFSIDTGTLDANDIIAGYKTSGSAGGTVSGTATIGGTAAAIFNGLTGPVALGVNSANNDTASGTFNLTGGTVGMAANGGNSMLLGNASVAGGTAAGTFNVTGGVATLAGDIVRGVATGTSTAVLNLDGGALDLSGAKIGGSVAANNLTSLTFASGTLRNVAEINNGADLGKTTAGTLILEGTNGYTGATNVTAGIVNVRSDTGLGATSAGTVVSTGATLQLSNNINVGAEALQLNGGAASGQAGAFVNAAGTNSFAGAVTVQASSTIAALTGTTLNLTGGVVKDGTTATFSGGGQINVSTVGITGASPGSDLVVDGGTHLNVSAASNYTGPTSVTGAGSVLEISGISGSLSATTSIDVTTGGTLLLSGGSERLKDTAAVNLSGGTLAFDNSLADVTETLGNLTLNNNSILDFGTGAITIGNTFQFGTFNPNGFTLNVYNWSGTTYNLPPEDDHGDPQDRLVFGGAIAAVDAAQINFFSGAGSGFLGNGAQIGFGSFPNEIVPVPEPSSTALIGAAGLLALVGYRERRRLSGMARRKNQRS